MKLLEENTLQYLTPRHFCPRSAYEFVLDASRAEREALADWCDENGLDLRIRSGVTWGRGLRITAIAFTARQANQLRAYLSEHDEKPALKLDLVTPLPADPLAAWAVAELADMRAREVR